MSLLQLIFPAQRFRITYRFKKDAGIVKVRKEATKNYYYFDADKDGKKDVYTIE